MKHISLKKILFLVQLPPPVHGVSMINNILLGNKNITTIYQTSVINLSVAGTIASIGKINFNKIFHTLVIFLKSIIYNVFQRPQLVYITFSPSGPAFLRDVGLCMIPKILGIKLLIHLHGKGLVNIAPNTIRGRLAYFIFKNSFVICLSEGLKKDLINLQPKEIFTLANGIDIIQKKLHKKRTDVINLLYLSNLVKSKGILDLLEALFFVSKRFTNWKLSIIGNEGDISFKEIELSIKEKELTNYIEILGPKYGEDKYRELQLADVLVFPTYYPNECFPLVILEAMQFGILVITTFEGAIPEIIEDGKSGLLFTQRSTRDLENCITKILKSPEIINQIGQNGQLEYYKKYTSEIMCKSFQDILRSILN